eukprot:131396-Pyramimonas_sp.AAC.1
MCNTVEGRGAPGELDRLHREGDLLLTDDGAAIEVLYKGEGPRVCTLTACKEKVTCFSLMAARLSKYSLKSTVDMYS